MLINTMARESFRLVSVKRNGMFYFEYYLPVREMRFFSCINISGRPFGRRMKSLLDEMHRIYEMTEVVRIGTTLSVYCFEPKSKKSAEYLESCAKSHGLTSFSHETYLDALAKERNSILKKSYIALGIIFFCFTVMFAVFGIISTWISFIPAALMLLLTILNLIRASLTD